MYIILPTYNREEKLIKVLKCLSKQTYQNIVIIVINSGNALSDQVEKVLNDCKSYHVINGKPDWWWAKCLQEGLDWVNSKKVSETEIVLFLNDDVTFNETFLQNAVDFFMKMNDSSIQLVAKISCDDGKTIKDARVHYNRWLFKFREIRKEEESNCLPTRGLFIRLKDIKKIGRFRPNLLPHYFSDYEFTYRGICKGIKGEATNTVYLCPDYTTTGFHKIQSNNIYEYIKKSLSKRSASNPIYSSIFIALTAPKIIILPFVVIVWMKFVLRVAITGIKITTGKIIG